MGEIVELAEWREARERDPVVRLERAVGRLELLLERGPSRIGRRVESELQEDAAERAERLAERLEHPSARLSG
jgi:TPP-dependent pyruvate/acetoin dehydrogenase alpha subunit